MPRKSKEEYNEYMRNYMKGKYKKSTGKPPMDGDFDGTNKPVLELNGDATKQLMTMGKEIFKDPETGKPDKIMTYIEQGAKYMPVILKFAEGFMSNMKAFNAQNPKQAEQSQPEMTAPEGWDHVSPMEKLKYKYSRPAWYEAGLAWDNFKQSGVMNPQINTGYVDPSYSQPRRGQPIKHDQQVNSLADLSKKHAEPPLIDDQPTPTDPVQRHDPKLEAVIKEKQKRHNPDKLEKQEKKTMEPNESDEIVKALQNDNARYIQMALKFLGSMSMKEFQEKINSLDQVVNKIKPFLAFLPIQLREMLKKTPDKELIEIFKGSCSDKFEWCKKNNHLSKISDMFNDLKSKI